MRKCCVSSCQTTSKNKSHDIAFHSIPKNHDKQKWIELVEQKNWNPNSNTVICSKHFEEKFLDRSGWVIKLINNAYPTLFMRDEETNRSITSISWDHNYAGRLSGCDSTTIQNSSECLSLNENTSDNLATPLVTPTHETSAQITSTDMLRVSTQTEAEIAIIDTPRMFKLKRKLNSALNKCKRLNKALKNIRRQKHRCVKKIVTLRKMIKKNISEEIEEQIDAELVIKKEQENDETSSVESSSLELNNSFVKPECGTLIHPMDLDEAIDIKECAVKLENETDIHSTAAIASSADIIYDEVTVKEELVHNEINFDVLHSSLINTSEGSNTIIQNGVKTVIKQEPMCVEIEINEQDVKHERSLINMTCHDASKGTHDDPVINIKQEPDFEMNSDFSFTITMHDPDDIIKSDCQQMVSDNPVEKNVSDSIEVIYVEEHFECDYCHSKFLPNHNFWSRINMHKKVCDVCNLEFPSSHSSATHSNYHKDVDELFDTVTVKI